MSLLFHMLPRFVIAFLPRRKCFSISWLQSLSTVILESNKINKISHCFHFFHFCLPWNDGTGYHDLRFLNVEVQVSFFTLLSPASGSLLGINTRTKQSNGIQFWCTPFSNFESVCCSMSSSNCCSLNYLQVSQEADKVVWYSHLFKNFPQFVVIHIVQSFCLVNM